VLDAEANWRKPGFAQSDEHPVTCVSQRDAIAFCEWLGKQEKAAYRLPTEAEWEYAARAGSDTIYAGGDEPATLYAFGNVGDAALEAAHPGTVKRQQVSHLKPGDGDGVVYTGSVGKFKPNAWGLYDMHGNVWEWCSDLYHDRYYDELTKAAREKGSWAKPAPTIDPAGPKTTPQHKYGDWRSMRGGSWYSGPMACRSASRAFGEAGDAFCYAGFRVVREAGNENRP
jgi:formylglycine-generating enzyme required for sulfatase activity